MQERQHQAPLEGRERRAALDGRDASHAEGAEPRDVLATPAARKALQPNEPPDKAMGAESIVPHDADDHPRGALDLGRLRSSPDYLIVFARRNLRTVFSLA